MTDENSETGAVENNGQENVSTQPQEPVQETKEVKQRPEFIPEKFWDAEKNDVNIENLAKSYVELDKMRGSMKDKVRQEIEKELSEKTASSVPEKYEVKKPEKLPEGVEFNFDENDPLVSGAMGFAKKHNLSQEAFDELVNIKLQADLASLPDLEKEKSALGVNADARIGRVNQWLDKNLGKEGADILRGAFHTADQIKALESLIAKTTGAAFLIDESATGSGETITLEKLREMQADPRYWHHAKREDSFVKKVEEGYKLLYSNPRKAG